MSCHLGVGSESFVLSHPSSSWVSKDYSSAFHDMGRCVAADASRESARRYGSRSMPPERLVQSRSRSELTDDEETLMTSYFAYDVIFPKIELLLRMRERIN